MPKTDEFLHRISIETGFTIQVKWERPCPACLGTGKDDSKQLDSKPCPACLAHGRCPGCQSPIVGSIESTCSHCGWRKGTVIDAMVRGFYRLARENSDDSKEIDLYWDSVLPELLDFWANQTFLLWNRHYIIPDAEAWAYEQAKRLPREDLSHMNEGELFLKHYSRRTILNMSSNPEYVAIVDQSTRAIHAPMPAESFEWFMGTSPHWVKSDFLYLPVTARLGIQIRGALLEQLKQILYAVNCWTTLIEKVQGNPVKKHTYGALMGRDDSFAWIQDWSQKIARRMVKKPLDWEDIAGNALEGWLSDLSRLKEKPRHIQMARLGTTDIAIKRNVIDELRKLYDEPVTTEYTDEVIATEAEPFVSEPLEVTDQKRTELKAALGETAFKIFEMRLDNPSLTAKQAAQALGISEKTVDRNRKKIRDLWRVVQGIVWD